MKTKMTRKELSDQLMSMLAALPKNPNFKPADPLTPEQLQEQEREFRSEELMNR